MGGTIRRRSASASPEPATVCPVSAIIVSHRRTPGRYRGLRHGTGDPHRRRGADRPARRRLAAARRGAGRRPPDRGRGHPPAAQAGGLARGDADRPDRLLLRRRRGGAGGQPAGRAARGPGRAPGHRCRDARDQRPRLPAGGGGRRRRGEGDGAARPFGRDRGAGGVGPAQRPVLLRGLPAAPAAMERALGPGRRAVACRELTKTHEEIRRGTLAELRAWAETAEGGVLGEVTLVIAGTPAGRAESTPGAMAEAVAEVIRRQSLGSGRNEAIAAVARDTGLPRRELYDAV